LSFGVEKLSPSLSLSLSLVTFCREKATPVSVENTKTHPENTEVVQWPYTNTHREQTDKALKKMRTHKRKMIWI